MKRTKFSYNSLVRSEKFKLTKIEREIQTRTIEIKKNAYEIGQFLCKAKAILPHGSFDTWREQTFGDDLPYSTAYHYRRIYLTFKDRPGAVSLIPTQYLLTLTQKQFPDEALQMIKEKLDREPESIEKWQLDEVTEFFDFMKKGTIGGNAFLKQVEKIIRDGHRLADDKMNQSKHRMNKNARRTLYFGLGDMLKKLEAAVNNAREMAGLFPFDPDDPEHKKVIKKIEKAIEKLQKLEIELEGGDGFLAPVSTENGEKYL